MSRLKDKVCVITGAGGGMGAEAAQVFTDEGAKVVVADVDSAAASKVADSVGGLAVQVDVADSDSVQAMYKAAAQPSSAASTSSTTTRASRPRTTTRSSRRISTPGSACRP